MKLNKMHSKQWYIDISIGLCRSVDDEAYWKGSEIKDNRSKIVDNIFIRGFIEYMYGSRVYKVLDRQLIERLELDIVELSEAVKNKDHEYIKVVFQELQFLFDEDYPSVKAKFLDYSRKRKKKTQLKRADKLQNNLEQSGEKKYKERYSVLDSIMRKKTP